MSEEFAEAAPWICIIGALAVGGFGEWMHARRVRRVAPLAFGPSRKPAPWAAAAPWLRTGAYAALAWALAILFIIPPRTFEGGGAEAKSSAEAEHVLLALDVSPSMRLVDAGPQRNISRMQRARELMESFFNRVPLEAFRVSVVAFYSEAKPVVVDTKDFEVIRNILGDLPMHFAFPSGKTKLFAGLEEAARVAKPWNPRSTTVVVLSDGDTVPASGMPKMPPSVKSVLVVGVGDPQVGKFIDGGQSRQDLPMLRQVAARLGGYYHNGNEMHIASTLISDAFGADEKTPWQKLTLREYALLAAAVSALLLSFLPLLLHYFGTAWNPGVPFRVSITHAAA